MLRIGGGIAFALVAAVGCGGEEFKAGDSGTGGASSAAQVGGSTSSSSGAAGGDGGAGGECGADSICVPMPEGWEGPVGMFIGSEPLDACPSPWTSKTTVNVGEPDATHTCSQCSCGAAANVSCSFPTVTSYFAGNCTAVSDPAVVTVLTSGGCHDVGGGYSSKSTIITPQGGSCAPEGGIPNLTEPAWRSVVTVCSDSSGPSGCSTGVCSPIAADPLQPGICVQRDGVVPCPDDFVDRVVAFRGVQDDRSCAECACSAPTGASCDGKLVVYGSNDCTIGPYVVPNDGLCHAWDYTSAVLFDPAATGGACSASGGAPKGGVQNALPVTICCRR